MSVLTHASPLDPRHALTDGAVWGFLMVKSLAEARILPRARDAGDKDAAKWARARQIIADAPDRLTLTLPGNHLFFVGEAGARRTVAALTRIRAEAAALFSELDSALS
jgi:hypothetical protein